MYSDDNVFVANTFSENAAGAALMFKLVPGIRRAKRTWPTPEGDRRVHCYILPSLSACREAFEKMLGQAIDWGDVADNPENTDWCPT